MKSIEFYNEELPQNSTLTLTGFGKLGAKKKSSDILQTIDLRLESKENCTEAYEESYPELVGEGHLCTFNEKSQGACGGDRFE